MHIHPAFFKQLTPLLHIPSNHCTFIIHFTICLLISTFSAFKKRITICNSQAAGFSAFVFNFNNYIKWKKKIMIQKRNTYVPLDIQKMPDLDRKCTCHLHSSYV
jgi:hypothetical protein